MKDTDRALFLQKAQAILHDNDKGSYTIPTHGLYPFQWNWDSCLTALGQSHFDEDRAWTEIETLFDHQWDDGMVPHIIFHEADEGYFPGPDIWQTGRPVPTSGITQPPVAGFVVAKLVERARDKEMAKSRAGALLPKISKWHEWFYRCRDPKGSGVVAILHPWETGRDNSIDWDAPFAAVSTEGVGPFKRRDTGHANPEHRPTDEQYRRYIKLIELFRAQAWDNARLHDISPFCVVDPGFNAILMRSCADIARLAETLDLPEIASRNQRFYNNAQDGLDNLWSDAHGQYVCYDRITKQSIDSASIGGILPVLTGLPAHRMTSLVKRIEQLGSQCQFLVPSHDPTDPRFDHLRYWRGPVWLIVNYMIFDGLHRPRETNLSQRIMEDCLKLVEQSGFAEYLSPIDATPCGGDHFTWTAAIVVELLNRDKKVTAGSLFT